MVNNLAEHRGPRSTSLSIVARALANMTEAKSESFAILARHEHFVRVCQAIIRLRDEKSLAIRSASSLIRRYERAELGFRRFVSLWQERVLGCRIEELKERYGSRVNGWLYGGCFPMALAHSTPDARAMSVDVGGAIVGTSPKLSFLLGATVSRVRPGFAGRTIQLRVGDSKKAAAFRAEFINLRKSLGVYSKSESPKGPAIELGYAISAHVAAVTNGNTTLPWKYLSTAEERAAFIRAFIIYSGISIVPEKSVIIQRKHGRRMLQEITALLLLEGVLSAFVPSENGGAVIISDQASRTRLIEILNEVPEASRSPRSFSQRAFHMAKESIAAGLPVYKVCAQLKKEFGVDFSHATISGWIRGVVPIAVQNEESARVVLREVQQSLCLADIGQRWMHDLRQRRISSINALYQRLLALFGDLGEFARIVPQATAIVKVLSSSGHHPTTKELADLLAHLGIFLSSKELGHLPN